MTVPNLEKVETSIVMLPAVDGALNITQEAFAKVVRDPVIQAVGQPPIQVEITSVRDQIVIRLVGGRFIFEDKSDSEPGSPRLPDVVQSFIQMLAGERADAIRAWGINFKVAFDVRGEASASEGIAEKYINKEALAARSGINVRGAGIRLYFEHASGALCDLQVEPRFGERDAPRLFAAINYHYNLPETKMPPLDTLKTLYSGLWPQFTELLGKLFVRS